MVTVTRQVEATPAEVFAVLADGWRYPCWVVGATRIRAVEPEWPAPGSRIFHSVGCWPALIDDTTQVVESVPDQRLRLRARGWPVGEADVILTCEPNERGTMVRLSEDAARGPGRLIPAALRRAALVPRNRETLERLAFLAEQRTTATP